MKEDIIIENGVKLEKETWYYDNGNIKYEIYYKDNKRYRDLGPAIIWYHPNGKIENEFYYKDSKLHRDNGPAIIWYDPNGNIERELYYLNDIQITDNLQIMVMKGLSNV